MMRLFLVLVAVAACSASEPPAARRDPVRFVLADANLDSTSIRVSVVDHATGAPVRATLCLDAWPDSAVTFDESGVVTVSGLKSGNLNARVLAQHYDAASLIFQPGRRGRMQANVRLAPNGAASATPSCATPTS